MALKGWQIQEIKKILGARREHSLPVTFSVQLFVKAICNEHIFKSPEMILNSVEAEFENQIKDKRRQIERLTRAATKKRWEEMGK